MKTDGTPFQVKTGKPEKPDSMPRMPHERDDKSFLMPADRLVDNLLPVIDSVPRARFAEAEILAEDRRVMPRHFKCAGKPRRAQQRNAMLAGKRVLAGNILEKPAELNGLGRGIGSTKRHCFVTPQDRNAPDQPDQNANQPTGYAHRVNLRNGETDSSGSRHPVPASDPCPSSPAPSFSPVNRVIEKNECERTTPLARNYGASESASKTSLGGGTAASSSDADIPATIALV